MRREISGTFGVVVAVVLLFTTGGAAAADGAVAPPTANTSQRSVSDQSWRPTYGNTPYPDIAASSDPAVISEGEYLFHAVGQCTSCHVPREQVIFVTPAQMHHLLPAGGQEWEMGELGVIRSANITQDRNAGIGAWTDREVARAVKYAVNRDGQAIFFMNGMGYIDDHDVRAIVSYLKTIRGVSREAPRTHFTSEGVQALRSRMQGWLEPRPQIPAEYVARGDVSARRGAYLANGPARCVHCHSNLADSPHNAIDGPAFAGSQWAETDPDNPAMEINAPNLTPSDRFGAISHWSRDAFIARIRAGRTLKSSTMPWENFRLMTDSDLSSIYLYLKSLPPVDRDVGPTYRPKGWKPAATPKTR